MKILIIAPTPFFADRGTHIRILEEALALEKRGHNLTIATYHIGRDISGEVKTNIDVRRIQRLLFWYKKLEAGPDWQKIILDLMLIRKVFYLARTQKPQVIHAHLHEGVLIGWIVKNLLFWRKMRLVADLHGSLTREMTSHGYLKDSWPKNFFEKLERFIDNLGDYTVTSSWEYTENLRQSGKNKKIDTLPDGVNIDYYRAGKSREDLKREFELPPGKMIFVYAGSLISNKGIGYLLGAIPRALENNDNIFFVIGGFPPEKVEIFIKENKLEGNVRLISPLNYFGLPEILMACDVGIDPKESKTRQASGKILQYMAAGLPVICFDKMNNRRYLGETGFYAQEVSADSIAQMIEYLVRNPGEVKKKGELSRQRVENFSWDASAEKIEKIYKDLLCRL